LFYECKNLIETREKKILIKRKIFYITLVIPFKLSNEKKQQKAYIISESIYFLYQKDKQAIEYYHPPPTYFMV